VKSKEITKSFGERFSLYVPQLEFEAGKIYAVMGANGSGKSTFARALAEEGMVEIDISVGYMPQKNYAFRMTVLKNVLLCASSEEKAEGLLRDLGMESLKNENAKKLSGGETAKMALARTLGKHFDLLILDEPTAPMDVESTYVSEKLIKDYCRDENAAMILITHSKGQAERMSDELLFFHKGRLFEKGRTKEILKDPKTKEAASFFSM